MRATRRAAAVVALAVLATAGEAYAGPPGSWTQVTGVGDPDRNTLEVGLARTGDGTLHVLWTREQNVLASRVSADARSISGPDTVFTYPNGANNRLALVAAPEGVRAFFAGLIPGHPLDGVLATATSADGRSWAVQPTPASNSATGSRAAVYAAAGIGAALARDGVPISVWGDSAPGQAAYHVGLSEADPDVHFGGSSATVAGPNVAVDSVSGQVAVAWNDLDTGRVLALPISPAGARLNTPGGEAPDGLERVAMTGRLGADGIYVAYLGGTNAFLGVPTVWRVGAVGATTVSGVRGARYVGVAAAPEGRLWAFWSREDRVYAARSNRAGDAYGAIVSIRPPSGTTSISSLEGEGSRGPLDLLALVQRSGDDMGSWHQRILPGLTLQATPKRGKVSFRVLDAGVPVRGATVRLGRRKKKTAADGRVTIPGKPGKVGARATKAGYAPARRKVKVK